MGKALLIIDFQNDFTPPEGALAVPDGDTIAPRLNELAADEGFDLVVATRDWHPENHGSFAEQGGPWPRHCVRGTEGAELDPALDADRVDLVLDKGEDPDRPGYSAFEEPTLAGLLAERGIESLTVAGLATDICVKHTAHDALAAGYPVTVDSAGTRGVDLEETARTLEELRKAGAEVHRAG